MTRHAERICELAQRSAEAAEPDAALRALIELRDEVNAFVDVQAQQALLAGRSFSDVARALGISRQAAHRRFRDLAPERRMDRAGARNRRREREGARDRRRPLAASDAARIVVRLARDEALAAGAPPASEHVLLGVMGTESLATRALRAKGVTPERVRAYAQIGRRRRTGDSSAIPRIVKRAAQIALARGDEELDVEALLFAAITDADGGAKRTLIALATWTSGSRDEV